MVFLQYFQFWRCCCDEFYTGWPTGHNPPLFGPGTDSYNKLAEFNQERENKEMGAYGSTEMFIGSINR